MLCVSLAASRAVLSLMHNMMLGSTTMNIAHHISRWFGTKPYTKASYITALATLIMAFTSALMCYNLLLSRRALRQGDSALELTRQSVQLQEREFRARMRPLIVIAEPHFGGKTVRSGGTYSNSISLTFRDVGDAPAIAVQGHWQLFFNGTNVAVGKMDVGVVAKGADKCQSIGLPDGIFESATQFGTPLRAVVSTTYSGLLGEAPDAYSTVVEFQHFQPDNTFRFKEHVFR